VGAAAGQEVNYQEVEPEKLVAIYTESGVPAQFADILVDTDVQVRDGALEVNSADLSQLIGRPTASLGKTIKEALAQ